MSYDISHILYIPSVVVNNSFLIVRHQDIIQDISLQYITIAQCISNIAHAEINGKVNQFLKDKTNISLNISLDVSVNPISLQYTNTNTQSLLEQFTNAGKLDTSGEYIECISGDKIYIILHYNIYSNKQIIFTDELRENGPTLTTSNIKIQRTISQQHGVFMNMPIIRMLIELRLF
jgi:hypothetical protein